MEEHNEPLLWIYIEHPLVFRYSLDECCSFFFFRKFAVVNFASAVLALTRLTQMNKAYKPDSLTLANGGTGAE